MAEEAKAAGIKVFAVTSSSLADADVFASEHQLPFTFSNADETLLKTMVRSNPGIMFWHQGTVIDKWSCRSIPSVNKLKKLMK
jgi:peroxiredoxin